MLPLPRYLTVRAAMVAVLLAVCGVVQAHMAGPKRVLLLHSFGRDFAPYDVVTSTFRQELAKGLPGSTVLVEATLDAGRPVTKEEEKAFVTYLRTRFAGSAPDVVVTIAPPAARFYLEHRDQLFPSPLIMAALDERFARGAALRANDTAVVGKVDLPRLFENIFELLPDTTTVAVVNGA